MDFPALLDTFAHAIERRDGNGLADLFTDDGVYDDYFFGPSKPGRTGICETVDHFYAGGTNYRWVFFSPLASDRLGYASYWFSYDSTLPEASGARVVFGGMSRFELQGGRIRRYSEVFDRGMALAQVGFVPERLQEIGLRYAENLNGCRRSDHISPTVRFWEIPASSIRRVGQRNESSIEIFKPASATASTKQAPSSSAFG